MLNIKLVSLVIFGVTVSSCGSNSTDVLKSKASASLNDPSSTQFRNIHLEKKDNILCGELNAKNGFGAYVGFRPFIVNMNNLIVMIPKPVSLEDMISLAARNNDDRKRYLADMSTQIAVLGQTDVAVGLQIMERELEEFPNWQRCFLQKTF